MRPNGKRRRISLSAALLLLLPYVLIADVGNRLDELGRRAMAALGRQDYAAALRQLREGAELSRREGNLRRAALFENAICGASFAAMEYAPSLKACASAIELAIQAKESEIAGVAELNRGNFLLTLGDTRAAEPCISNALSLLDRDSPRRAIALTALGAILSRRGKHGRARQVLEDAVELAAVSTDRSVEAFARGTLGELELSAGNLDRAEAAFLSTFRIRKLHRLPQLESAWWKLGALRLAQGRPEEALRCFEHGLESRTQSRASFANFLTLHGKGRALAELGDRTGARAALQLALRESQIWRNEMAPAEGIEIAADVRLAALAEEFAAVSETTGAEAWEAFEALESTRAMGLRRQMLSNLAMGGRIPDEYLDLVRSARKLARAAASGDRAAAGQLRAVEAKIGRVEGELRIAVPGGATEGTDPDRIQEALSADQVLISFLTGQRSSRVWVLTREGRASALIPGEAALAQAVEDHRRALLSGSDFQAAGRRLYQLLLGGIPPALLKRAHWHLVADGPLWSVPWAALVQPDGGQSRFLIESASLEMLPSVAWLSGISPEPRSRLLIAAGDAIHNRADPRLKAASAGLSGAPWSFWFMRQLGPQASPGPLELPTLAGSVDELAEACKAWASGPCKVVSGSSLTLERLEGELAHAPAVVHLATHMIAGDEAYSPPLPAPELGQNLLSIPKPAPAFLALTLKPDLTRDIIYYSDVSRMYTPGALIVLSACESGRGTVLPGAGLQGFARAWLAAGSRAVVGSLWQVSDGTAEFFKEFYNSLASGIAPAKALRSAQIRSIRARNWQSHPRFWSAYMLLGKG
jgi:CHAT domain-containing protein